MLVVLQFRVAPEDEESFVADAQAGAAVLAGRPGCRSARLGRGLDDPSVWLLVTEWDGVGAYRRALSSYDVKVGAAPLFARAPDGGGFEVLYDAATGAAPSDRGQGGRA